jgi:TolA-binding protein
VGAVFSGWEEVTAIAGAVAAGAVVWPRLSSLLSRSGMRTTASATVDIYRENNEALKEQNDLRVAEIHDLTAKLKVAEALSAAQQRQLDSQQEQIRNLRELVLQVKGIDDLKVQIGQVHAETMAQLKQMGGGSR